LNAKPDCIFCSIIAGTAPADRIYEDDRTLIFMDLFPAQPWHSLIIPKLHGENLFEVEPHDLQAVVMHSKTLAEAMRRVFDPDGISVVQLNGEAAGQAVFHYHMHLIPRTHGTPWGVHGKKQGDAQTLADQAAQLAEAFNALS